jgi:hypothetical protein
MHGSGRRRDQHHADREGPEAGLMGQRANELEKKIAANLSRSAISTTPKSVFR